MEVLAEPLRLERPEVDRELRIRTDTTTWLAETLHGSMRTSFEFNFDGQELRAEDGSSLNDIFDESIAEAKTITESNPSMLFELRRRLIERDELDDMYKMINGELPNTMVVISDFPPELMNAKEDVGGYNANRQQTMMRVITLGENGKLRITTQSLDGSDRQALEAIYAGLTEPVQEGELLSQRIYRDMSPQHQENLTDNLTKVYDDSLTQEKGGEWHAGISQRPDRNIVNTYDFARAQTDVMEWFVGEKLADSAGAEKLRYKLAATVGARHKRYLKASQSSQTAPGRVSYESLVNVDSIASSMGLQYELNREEKQAIARGEEYSGCGFTAKAEDGSDGLSGNDILDSLGYGNKSGSGGRDKLGSLKFKCPKGHENTRPKNKLIPHCTTCGVAVDCKPKTQSRTR